MKHLLKCVVCGKYSLQKMHCNKFTITSGPAKWNPSDKYGSYRRKVKGLE